MRNTFLKTLEKKRKVVKRSAGGGATAFFPRGLAGE